MKTKTPTTLTPTTTLALVLLSMTGLSHAATINVFFDTDTASNVVGGVNLGGLDIGATNVTIPNGDDVLKLQYTVDDTADTGATFTGIVTLTGTTNAGTGIYVNAAGKIVLQNSANPRSESVTMAVGVATQTGGPAATINFNGFNQLDTGNLEAATDDFQFNGIDYDGFVGADLINVPLAPSGSVVDDIAGDGASSQWRLEGFQANFTVSPVVPEPSSLSLLALGSLGLFRRRRS